MIRRPRRSAARASMTAAVMAALCLSVPSVAGAYLTSDLTDFNLTESVSLYGGTQYHIATGTDGVVSYRWVDSPSKQTIIGPGSCADGAPLATGYIYSASDTGYHTIYSGGAGLCFYVRGRTTSGQGPMTYYDGRLQR